jgi:ribonuclease P protein subunit RPR2
MDRLKKRQAIKELAEERVQLLVNHAVRESDEERTAELARNARVMAMHFRLRLPYHIRQLYCKKCKALIVPGRNARVRLGRYRTRAIRITCLRCGHVYRKILTAE